MITRRQLIVLGGVGGVVALGAGWLLRRRGPAPDPWTLPLGDLADPERQTLEATVLALFDVPKTIHYTEMFAWRARNLAGDRAVQVAFVAEMNRRLAGFASASRSARLVALQDAVFLARDAHSALFYSHVITPIVIKYSLTDAWIAQGYDAWPGTPRGFETYLAPAPGDPSPRR